MFIKRAFSLVELLLVILIVSLSYGVIYNLALKEKKPVPLTDSEKLIYFIQTHPLYKKESLWLFCNEDNECYVGKLFGNKLLEEVEFTIDTPYLSYILDKYSKLNPYDFFNVRVNNFSFKPYIIVRVDAQGVIENHFLHYDDEWLYYSFFEKKYISHINSSDVIAYAKKNEYFPYLAGDINDR